MIPVLADACMRAADFQSSDACGQMAARLLAEVGESAALRGPARSGARVIDVLVELPGGADKWDRAGWGEAARRLGTLELEVDSPADVGRKQERATLRRSRLSLAGIALGCVGAIACVALLIGLGIAYSAGRSDSAPGSGAVACYTRNATVAACPPPQPMSSPPLQSPPLPQLPQTG